MVHLLFYGRGYQSFAGGEVWSIIMQVSTFSNWGVIHCLVCGGVVHCLACGGACGLSFSMWRCGPLFSMWRCGPSCIECVVHITVVTN